MGKYFLIGCVAIVVVGAIGSAIKDFIKYCKDVSVEEIVSTIVWVIGFFTVPTIIGYIVYMIITYFIG